ncbi:MAG: hypothetical protein ACK4TA_24425 [Saprospiraceae bacterium]
MAKKQKIPAKTMPLAKQTVKTQAPAEPFWRKHWLPAMVLMAVAIAIYLPTLGYEYVLDDKIVMTENNYVKQGWSGIGTILTTESLEGHLGKRPDLIIGARYRPLSLVTFAIEYSLWGLNPTLSHLVNVLLHGLLAVVLFRLLHLMLPTKKAWYISLPFVITLLYLLHPIHSEAVANVKGRDEIMAALGAFGALFYSLLYARSGKLLHSILSSVLFFLALLSKESALPMLAVIPLTLYFFSKAKRNVLISNASLLLISSILYLIIRYNAVGYLLDNAVQVQNVMLNPFLGVAPLDQLGTILYTLLIYIKLLIFPHPLTIDYYPYHIPIISIFDWRALLSLVLHIGLIVLAIKGLKQKTIPSYGILFYLITLSIVSNLLVSVGVFMSERFVFIPSLGFSLILGWILVEKLPEWLKINRLKPHLLTLIAVGLLSAAYLVKLFDRLPDWQNGYELDMSAATVSPNSARANLLAGAAIYTREYNTGLNTPQKLELLQEILYFVNKSIKIVPTYTDALNFKASLLGERYSLDNDLQQLLAEYYQIAQVYPNGENMNAYLNWIIENGRGAQQIVNFAYQTGYEYFAQQRKYQEAIYFLQFGEKANPNDPRIRQALGQVYQQMGNQAKAAFYLN